MDTEKIKSSLCHAFCEDIQLMPREGGLLFIKTPFTFPDGDHYQLYLKELPTGGFRVTDAGHTWMQLSYDNDIANMKEGTRGQLLSSILMETGIVADHGAFFMDVTADGIASAIMRMGVALTKVHDLTFLNRARVESTFYDDLDERMGSILPAEIVQRNYSHPLVADAQLYPIDYYVKGNFKDLCVFGVPNRDKARLTTIILGHLIQNKAKFDSLIIMQDMDNLPKTDLRRLLNLGGEMIASLDAEDDLTRKLTAKAYIN